MLFLNKLFDVRVLFFLAVAFIPVFISAQPCSVNITPAAATICAGSSVNLSANGSGPGTTYTWSPAAGLNTTTGNNVVASPNATTTYVVSYACPGSNTVTDTVIVTVLPSVTGALFDVSTPSPPFFTNCVSSGSSAFTLTIDGTGTGNVSTYSLNWGDGSPPYTGTTPPANLTHTYNGQGFYTISYILTTPNGCNDTVNQTVFNGSNPAVGMGNPGNTNGCLPLSITFPINNTAANPPGTTYTVSFNDGSPPVVYAHPPPASVTHVFTNTSCGTNSPGNPPFNNSFSATIVASNPCGTSAATVVPIRVSRPGVADFSISPVPGCINQPVTFTNTSINPVNVNGSTSACDSTPAMTWAITPPGNWTVTSGILGNANGSISGSNILGVTFNAPGTYTVSLILRGVCGNDTMTRQVCITGPPTAAMTATPSGNCVPVNVTTVNTSSTVFNCAQTTYSWSVLFNPGVCSINNGSFIYTGGTSSTSASPSFQLQDAGNYFLILTATNVCGSDTAGRLITVGSAPVISVAPVNSACGSTSFTPSANFNGCNQAMTTFNWSFPGGNPATFNGQNPGVVNYTQTGPNPVTYTITATATNQCGAGTDTAQFTLYPVPSPTAISSAALICRGDSVQLTVSQAANYSSVIWTPPTGLSSTSGSPVNAAPQVSTQYTATVSNGPGCTGTASVQVNVTPPPNVTTNAATICSGDTAVLTASGAGGFSWSNGASGSSISVSPTVTTVYTVTGTDVNTGCTATSNSTVTVQPLPAVSAGPDSTVCNQGTPVVLSGNPAGGVWTGIGINAGLFHPDSAGLGVWNLTYTYTDPTTGCQNIDNVLYSVTNPSPALAGPDMSLCEDSSVTLNGSPAGGTWSGTGVSSSGLFNPNNSGQLPLIYSYGFGSCQTTDTVLMTVHPLPALNLAGNTLSSCVYGNPFTLTAQPPGGTWSGVGVSAGTFDPATAGVGNWNISYTFSDNNGCSNTASIIIDVDPRPAVIAGNDTTVCDLPAPVFFSGNYSNTGTWSGPGISPAGVFTPSGPGSSTLIYSYTDANGCSGEDSLVVTVVPPQIAEAGPGATVCADAPPFLLTGFTPATGGAWSGPGILNSSSGLFDPFSAAPAGGTVTLYYSTGQGNCFNVDSTSVTIYPLPAVSTGPDIDTCITVGAFQLGGYSPAGGSWSGPGIINAATGFVDPLLAGPGTHELVYTVTDQVTGCSNRDTVLFTVFPLPVTGFDADTLMCVNVPYTVQNNSSGAASWFWDFGNGTISTAVSPTVTYTSPGNYSILQMVTSPGGCIDSLRINVQVVEPPLAGFTLSPYDGCGPLAVTLNNNSTGSGLSFFWDFGNGVTDTVRNPGTRVYDSGMYGDTVYTITLNVSNICGAVTVKDSITVFPSPQSLFGTQVSSGCSPLTIQFSNNSYGLPLSYQWDFGDGTGSADSLPVPHVYFAFDNDTTYYITLITTNLCGSDTLTDSITVFPNTVNAFFNTDPVSGCAPLTVEFTNFSTGGNLFSWDFGDGNVSSQYTTTHTYTAAGTYDVSLIVNNTCSFDTAYVQITVWPQPGLSFTSSLDSSCVLESVSFNNTSPDPLIGVLWDFGDGVQSTLSNPIHAYTTPGNYTVTFIGTGSVNGCIDTVYSNVFVHPKPLASFDSILVEGCQPLPVNFANTSAGAGSFIWDFGDGNTSILSSPVHIYYNDGSFQVGLVAISTFGCTDTATGNVLVRPKPTSAFNTDVDSACGAPATVSFLNGSTQGTGSAWLFGDGQGSALTNPVHTYIQTGSYTVQLISTTSFGCLDTAVQPFTVHPAPLAQATIVNPTGCDDLRVFFNNQSQNAVTFLWFFGDGDSSMMAEPDHLYTSPGQYNVQLIITGSGGCRDTFSLSPQITVLPSPEADFSYDQSDDPALYGVVNFLNASAGAVRYSWDFGDSDTSALENPKHRYASYGQFDVRLIAIGANGCADTLIKPLDLRFFGGLVVPNAFAPESGTADALYSVFLPAGISLERYRLEIYDTWGTLLWYSEALQEGRPSEGWDGKVNGIDLPADVYIWKISAWFTDGTPWTGQRREPGSPPRTTGTVTLIR